jgi:hypothetical protein
VRVDSGNFDHLPPNRPSDQLSSRTPIAIVSPRLHTERRQSDRAEPVAEGLTPVSGRRYLHGSSTERPKRERSGCRRPALLAL